MAAPIPLDAPVIMATFPLSRCDMAFSLKWLLILPHRCLENFLVPRLRLVTRYCEALPRRIRLALRHSGCSEAEPRGSALPRGAWERDLSLKWMVVQFTAP